MFPGTRLKERQSKCEGERNVLPCLQKTSDTKEDTKKEINVGFLELLVFYAQHLPDLQIHVM